MQLGFSDVFVWFPYLAARVHIRYSNARLRFRPEKHLENQNQLPDLICLISADTHPNSSAAHFKQITVLSSTSCMLHVLHTAITQSSKLLMNSVELTANSGCCIIHQTCEHVILGTSHTLEHCNCIELALVPYRYMVQHKIIRTHSRRNVWSSRIQVQ